MISLLTLSLLEGSVGVVGSACSITSFSLMVMMSLVRLKIAAYESSQSIKTAKELPIVDSTRLSDTGTNLGPNEIILNKGLI